MIELKKERKERMGSKIVISYHGGKNRIAGDVWFMIGVIIMVGVIKNKEETTNRLNLVNRDK
jgi:hypothetical protein